MHWIQLALPFLFLLLAGLSGFTLITADMASKSLERLARYMRDVASSNAYEKDLLAQAQYPERFLVSVMIISAILTLLFAVAGVSIAEAKFG